LFLVLGYVTLSISDATRQFWSKPISVQFSERFMIADIQTQDSHVTETAVQEPLLIVQDAELLYVGGGSHGCLF
jgi:hypothetical protein